MENDSEFESLKISKTPPVKDLEAVLVTRDRAKGDKPVILYIFLGLLLIALFIFVFIVMDAIFLPDEEDDLNKVRAAIVQSKNPDAYTVSYEGKMWDYISEYSYSVMLGTSEKYEEDPYDYEDEEYYFYDDYIDTSVGYEVTSNIWGFTNDDGYYDALGGIFPRNLYIYYQYCQLENTGLTNEEELNRELFDACHLSTDMYEYYDYEYKDKESLYVDGYATITYMDSDVMSVLFQTDGYFVEDPQMDVEGYKHIMSGLEVRNIDMKTGKFIETSSMFTFDEKFVDEMISECKKQNEGVDITKYIKKKELIKMAERGEIIWFYTPVGIEFGIVYPNYQGYSTFTCSDYEKFIKH